MKKLSIIACLLLAVCSMNAQHKVNSFFDELGTARIQTVEYSPYADTIVTTFHRTDDILWSRVVYRIIDLRYKQNYQLYFPYKENPDYKNLFRVITDAIVDGLTVYPVYRDKGQIEPEFSDPLEFTALERIMRDNRTLKGVDRKDTLSYAESEREATLIRYDREKEELSYNPRPFESITRNQLKYLVQELVFFDRHTSRLHIKIMAIAPMNSAMVDGNESVFVASKDPLKDGAPTDTINNELMMQNILNETMFWIPFDKLRPYLALQYIIPSQNETKRVTYDEFFQKRLFSSYILGEGNMYNRMIPEYAVTVEDMKKEQARIENELLNFEQDLWEY